MYLINHNQWIIERVDRTILSDPQTDLRQAIVSDDGIALLYKIA
jgi:hypothetical protein